GASDYRYFPEPDLVDFEIDERRLERVRESMPELPDASRRRLVEVYAIPEYDAFVLTAETSTLRLYESTVGALLGRLGPDAPPTAAKTVSNWVMVVLAGHLNEHGITLAELSVRVGSHDPIGRQDGASVLPSRLADVIALRLRGEVSEPAARRLFEAAMESAEPIEKLVEKLDLRAVSDEDTVRSLVREVLAAHPDEVARYRSGATKLMRFFIGQVLGRTGGKADPELATRVLLEELGNGGTT
ncbi:MAG: Asp-tRNA(Asn)/Glu-tRNA(Gln) amidotransferase GatCAB subunit B, partial [Candidatus Eisenbacteria sp.]|nr:Asp-tRNA(Asn)/Glu-tRNA(Gln) amidotransferase GatCAB subunit B [Candidatus Eisenbacteria bacterium]